MRDEFRWTPFNLKMVMVCRIKDIFIRSSVNEPMLKPPELQSLATQKLLDEIQKAYVDACSQASKELGVLEYFERNAVPAMMSFTDFSADELRTRRRKKP